MKKAIEVTKELGGSGYTFWGGREGYQNLWNTDLKREFDHLAAFMHMAVDHAKQIGFTGPLSRQLLGYHSMIAAVRNSMRDLVEVCLTTLLLNGEADRARTDWYDLGLDLPFLLDNDCGLGLLVNNYLFELYNEPKSDPTNEDTRLKAKEAQQRTFAHAVDTEGDLKRAFALWDAVSLSSATVGLKLTRKFSRFIRAFKLPVRR